MNILINQYKIVIFPKKIVEILNFNLDSIKLEKSNF